ncbi:MAG: hypothetical protein MK066_03960 [Crocinitomicaceae bacterium]|nr:hypothetical protein [Crocinitomicaceae bacterium]
MYFWKLASLFLISIVKFMFAPFGGPGVGLTFIETYLACVAGGIFGSAIFYFASSYLMESSKRKKQKKKDLLIKQGLPVPKVKNFTRMNKFIVRIKRSLGIYGTAFWAPFFLSVPIGSIVTAKFYSDDKRTYPLIVLGMFINGLITTTISFFIWQ